MLGIVAAGLLAAGSQSPWLLTVQTTGVSQTYTIDINAGTSPVILVDWGDGTVETFTTTGQKTHTYAAAGTYVAKLSGRFASGGNIRFGSDAGNASRLKAVSAAPYIPGLISFQSTFYLCTGLTGAIPEALFWNNPQVSQNGFNSTFRGCTGLTGAIPERLFWNNPLVSTAGFYSVFFGCSSLTGEIPERLFWYNTLVSDNGFNYAFYSCYGLTGALPAQLFRFNTNVSSYGFNSTFQSCSNLSGAIPTGFFQYNILVSTAGFASTFYGCASLTSAPGLLFAYCPSCNDFSSTFRNCNKLQLPSNLFSEPADYGTRFLNKSVSFANAMSIGAFTGTQGTAPALWSYNFGSGTPTKTSCFSGHSSSTVSNYADIPADWK